MTGEEDRPKKEGDETYPGIDKTDSDVWDQVYLKRVSDLSEHELWDTGRMSDAQYFNWHPQQRREEREKQHARELEAALWKIEDLRKYLSSADVVQEEEKRYIPAHVATWDPSGLTAENAAELERWAEEHGEWEIVKPRITKGDVAKKGLGEIYSSSGFQEARIAAGRALGYSTPRILFHEYPIATTAIGVATAGATFGSVYALVEYFSK